MVCIKWWWFFLGRFFVFCFLDLNIWIKLKKKKKKKGKDHLGGGEDKRKRCFFLLLRLRIRYIRHRSGNSMSLPPPLKRRLGVPDHWYVCVLFCPTTLPPFDEASEEKEKKRQDTKLCVPSSGTRFQPGTGCNKSTMYRFCLVGDFVGR